MQHSPFTTLSWRDRLIKQARKWAALSLRPLLPSRLDPSRDGPPNLLVLAVDTLRYDHLGLGGYARPTSPALDQMASAGTVFHDATAPAPWTLPSFASALTGVMPGWHGAKLKGETRDMGLQPPQRLRPEVLTLATHLAQQGYRTAAFTSNPFFGFGLAESFQEHSYHNLPAGDLAFLAMEWIRRHAERPFFCFVLFNDPHEPTTPPASRANPFLADLAAGGTRIGRRELRALARWGDLADRRGHLGYATLPLPQRMAQALAAKIALYDGAIAYVDAVIGNMRKRLERWQLEASTLVTVFSDHGEEFLDHLKNAKHWDHDPREIRAIGHGHTLFQELLHVPWLATGPGVPAGAVVHEPVSLCDVAFTLSHWLGVDPLPRPPECPDMLCGGDVAAGITGCADPAHPAPKRGAESAATETMAQNTRVLLAEDIAYGPDLVAIRQGVWKLISSRGGQSLGLYNLATDPVEHSDRRQAEPEVLERLQDLLRTWRQATPGQGGTTDSGQGREDWQDISETVRRRLEDLGYSD